eukprot:TRINITY_DN18684_c0_g1_i1.p1 TRINITY_DN18684_c0_g1~~TRINITY_DN18684_c0_g1_i1.p1  ORF type:complete len:387 (+),score=158.20 TRINITY_DN18684_c0_g1_i1:104-1162(+)
MLGAARGAARRGFQQQARNPQQAFELLRAAAVATGGVALAALNAKAWAEEDSEAAVATEYSRRHKQTITTSWKKYTIEDITDISHNVRIFRFALKDPEQEFHIGTTCTLQVGMWDWNVETNPWVERHYTPVTPNNTKGHFDLLIKHYPDGFMTERLWKLKPGDQVKIRRQTMKLKYLPNKWESVNMIAGGVGITPMLQLIRTVAQNPEDRTKVTLLFCNRTIEDILLADELRTLQEKHPDKIQVHFMVDDAQGLDWKGLVGRTDAKVVHKLFPCPWKGKHLMCVCGPDGMLQQLAGVSGSHMSFWSHKSSIDDGMGERKGIRQPTFADANNFGPVGGVLGNLGWTREQVYCF